MIWEKLHFQLKKKPITKEKQSNWGILVNCGVKNRTTDPIMTPIVMPDNPARAPLPWFTDDLGKEP
jgi:hypothetical protein